ncbi:MAG: alginate lyase family protein [Eubacteriales bacterium]|nr:alginate lyase family protein [Eubacteriales bacterium]
MSFVLTDNDFIYETKRKIQENAGVFGRVKLELQYMADLAMMEEPLSITQIPSPAASGNPHDYFSEGPYWWPDPQNPDGPYIRRDGEHNPDRFDGHRIMLEKMCKNVLVLAQAGYFLDKPRYTRKAVKMIKVWFLNRTTRMNPNLEYGQAIRGVCDGRGIGIIETKVLISVVHAAGFIAESGKYDKEIDGLKEWFAKYLKWLNESEKGIEEREWFNNHSIWWTAQALDFAAFTDNKKLMVECYDRFKEKVVGKQLNDDSAFEDELHRTRSYSYYLFSLSACAVICEIAHTYGVDLWNYKSPDGKSLKGAFEFMFPYFKNMFGWEYQQISINECLNESLAFQLASLRYKIPEYEKPNGLRRKDKYLVNNISDVGSPVLLPGFSCYE